MRTWPLQLLFWATSSVPGPQGAYLPGNLTCLNNYQYKLNCSWTSPGPTAAKDGPFRIHFIHNLLPYEFTCPVQPGPAPALLVSTCQAPNVFTSWDRFNVSLRGTNVFYLTDALYLPRLNIKPDCPTELKSNVSSRSCVISWQPPLRALAGHLSYQLDFKKIEEPWEVARRKNDIGGVTWLVLEAFEFKASGAMYQARLRCRPGQRQTSPEYAGPWSHWSRPLAFRSPIPPDPTSPPGAGEQPFPTVTFLSILLSIIILPYLVVKLSPRVKRTFYKNVPSPAGFFKPLYAVHNGNFQEPCPPEGEGGGGGGRGRRGPPGFGVQGAGLAVPGRDVREGGGPAGLAARGGDPRPGPPERHRLPALLWWAEIPCLGLPHQREGASASGPGGLLVLQRRLLRPVLQRDARGRVVGQTAGWESVTRPLPR
ncbi:interleukin-9 receptor-like isoform X2 [Tachyglossus aculeatus]|uniref:interleukin-9 receptor-like isoform X2 n=1 Tax=Tachyglossus aculeatus TaxID=9261 RepID=UPI0018F57688|nr:interleukin-9 receptor-like isoform X2 [Tachyglossus aculeatus]